MIVSITYTFNNIFGFAHFSLASVFQGTCSVKSEIARSSSRSLYVNSIQCAPSLGSITVHRVPDTYIYRNNYAYQS